MTYARAYAEGKDHEGGVRLQPAGRRLREPVLKNMRARAQGWGGGDWMRSRDGIWVWFATGAKGQGPGENGHDCETESPAREAELTNVRSGGLTGNRSQRPGGMSGHSEGEGHTLGRVMWGMGLSGLGEDTWALAFSGSICESTLR